VPNARTLGLHFHKFVLIFALASGAAIAAEDKKEAKNPVQAFLESLKPIQGRVEIGSGLASANIPPEFKFLQPDDAGKVVYKLWGNPPSGDKPLGLIYPSNQSLTNADGWAIIVQYSKDGYVKDDDATKIDYAELLQKIQAGAKAESKAREQKGYPPVEIVGWAAPPRYDAETHKLYWAKEIKFGDSETNTLNYNIRMLGRRGVLVLNAVAPISRLKDIEAAAPAILAMVDFKPGETYADFKPGSDKVAVYGIAALVAGGLAVKAGLFKGLLIALLAAKKFIIIGAVALFGFIKRLFGGKKTSE
jgi:uncharacterized membrane-anchored protein